MKILYNYLIMNAELLRQKRKEANLTQEQLAEKVRISKRTIINYEKGSVIPDKTADELSAFFQGYNDAVQNRSEKSETITMKPEAVLVRNYTELQNRGVPLVSFYAYGGYLNGFSDPEYLESLPKIPVADEVERKGEYLFFEVRGDSMDDGTKRSIAEKDLLLCRNINRDYWKSKLHLHKWDRYVIVHRTEGILIKEITHHDVERGIITIHSYNDFYPDQQLSLADVQQLFNVIEVRRR